MPNSCRPFISLLLATLLVAPGSFAFSSPLSDEAIREAYFLGQRRDESMARFLDKYRQYLPEPERGPQIYSVGFLTPFANLVLLSSEHTVGYSAQQAAKEYRGLRETVSVTVEVLLTESYGSLIARPTSERSGSPVGYAFRSPDFWRDIQVQVMVEDKILKPAHFSGEPNYLCNEHGCILTGAMLHLDFPAGAFNSDAATVQVTPPEGPEVFVDFDLTALR
jgi:hypothetical protein